MTVKQKHYLLFLFLIIPVVAYQNCADNMIPEHNTTAELSSGSDAFSTTLFPVLRTNCSECHGVFQQPMFAVSDPSQALATITDRGLANLNNPSASTFVLKIRGGHSGKNVVIADQIEAAITAWAEQSN